MQLGFTRLENVALLALIGFAGCNRASMEVSEPSPDTDQNSAASPPPLRSVPGSASDGTALRGPESTIDSGAEALAAIDENLSRLRDLAIFEVGDLIVQLPAEATNCYGAPCPGSEPAILAARTEAAVRLENLADAAETAVDSAFVAYECLSRVDANLEALRQLSIVEVGTFIQSEPQNNPYCYNLPCTSDVEAANADNEARATELESIALAAEQL